MVISRRKLLQFSAGIALANAELPSVFGRFFPNIFLPNTAVAANIGGIAFVFGGLTVDAKTLLPAAVSKSGGQKNFLIWGPLENSLHSDKENLFQRVEIPFAPHSVLIHPFKKNTVLAIPNNPQVGDVMEVDLEEHRLSYLIKNLQGRGYYGHGVFDPVRKVLMLVEYIGEQKTAVILRDSKDYKVVGQFDSYGSHPHDISFMPDGNLLVCNHNLANVIDPKDGKLLISHTITDESQILAHIQLGDPNEAFILSGVIAKGPEDPTGGHLFRIDNKEKKITRLDFRSIPKGQALSSALDREKKQMLVTHPDGDCLSAWDTNSGKNLSVVNFSGVPRGVQFDLVTKTFLVTNIKGEVFDVSIVQDKILSKKRDIGTFANASHFTYVPGYR